MPSSYYGRHVLMLGVSCIDLYVIPAELVRLQVVVGFADAPVSTEDFAFVQNGNRRVNTYPEHVEATEELRETL